MTVMSVCTIRSIRGLQRKMIYLVVSALSSTQFMSYKYALFFGVLLGSLIEFIELDIFILLKCNEKKKTMFKILLKSLSFYFQFYSVQIFFLQGLCALQKICVKWLISTGKSTCYIKRHL